jgi:hypothetical protein
LRTASDLALGVLTFARELGLSAAFRLRPIGAVAFRFTMAWRLAIALERPRPAKLERPWPANERCALKFGRAADRIAGRGLEKRGPPLKCGLPPPLKRGPAM